MAAHHSTPTQVCSKCGEEYPLTAEYWHRDKTNRTGFRIDCKECCCKKARNWHSANRFQTCSHCNRNLPLSAHNWHRDKTKATGFRSICKECASAYNREYHREKMNRIEKEGFSPGDESLSRSCRECNIEYPLTKDYWHVHKPAPYGLRSICKSCACRKTRNWVSENKERSLWMNKRNYWENRDYYREKQREYYWNNPEKCRRATRIYHQENKEKVRQSRQRWREANRQKVRFYNRKAKYKRRAKKKRASGEGISQEELSRKWRMQSGKCWHCEKDLDKDDYHADHLIPLAKGGTNESRNIVFSCPHCNLSKQGKLPSEWSGRLF